MKAINRFRFWGCAILAFPAAVCAGTLADLPLSLKGSVPPNVMFALSVEYPTANTAAYQGANDYSDGNEYLGYFDNQKCYDYDFGNGWFFPTGTTTNHQCSALWSGNFLNWATMTGLDEFRYAMTGGNRYQDTASLTVLERTYQSGQGGTGNFPDKTFVGSGATPYPNATSIKVTNQGQGVKMLVAPTGSSDVVDCSNPTGTGTSFSCALTLQSNGDTGSCSTWSGSGTSASPFQCTAFGAFNAGVPTTVTVGTKASYAVGGTAATVQCASPAYNGGVFSCGTLTLANGHSGSCSSWTGSGSSASPFSCASFGTFSGGESFAPGGGQTVSTFTQSGTAQQTANNPVCTYSSSSITCTLPDSSQATCSPLRGRGDSGSPYKCNTGSKTNPSVWTFSGSGNSLISYHNSSTPTVSGSNYYYLPDQIVYSQSGNVTYSYVSQYVGATGAASYYYYSSYSVGFAGSQSYNVRVKVCDASVGQESNCKAFGTAWKPTGVVQDNGDRMRFGVTSYFQANDIDNAVLRSKLKYVAPQKYSSSGGSITNPNTEWSAADGTLVANPDSSDPATNSSFVGTTSNSGVINYINKFGSSSHTYKTYDDTGKLYYETLKYLRGLSPTGDFYNGATLANSDGFPVITQWDDPIQYSCQKSYIIAMGDTHTWCDKRLPGGTYAANGSSACNAYTDSNGHSHASDQGSLGGDTAVDVTVLTNGVGSSEGMGNIATTYTGAGNTASYYIAGLAKWAASNDIRPDSGSQPQTIGRQTVNTYIVDVEENRDCGYRSQYWLAAKYGNAKAYDSNGNWLSTANPAMTTASLPSFGCAARQPPAITGSSSVLWPSNLLKAGDPLSMIASVKGAIQNIVAEIGEESALAQSSGSLNTGTGAYIYRAIYNSGGWIGDVQALTIDQNVNIASSPAWSAASKLPAPASRTILTFNDGRQPGGASETTTNSRRGVLFDPASFSTNLSTGQQAALNQNEFGTADSLGVDRMNYVRGDQSKEAMQPGTSTPNASGNGWRARTPAVGNAATVASLGDFINSNPTYVAAPEPLLPGAGYGSFASAHASRKPMVYVGGNDGMVHGFDASFTIGSGGVPVTTSTSGTELVAYVPAAVYGNLSKLMSPNYSHKYFVDGSPVASEACFGSCSGSSDWKTILVGGLNAGGQGVYALDITDPTSFSASSVLWEFTDKDDADLGFTFGRPIVRRLNSGKWAVIFGNGFNNTYPDGSSSSTGRAYLYIVYVDGPGAGNAWTQGTNYFKIELRSPSEPGTPAVPANGLAGVAGVDRNLDGTVDIVYAGDRNGNVWKIDLSSSNPTQWKSAFGSVSAPSPLFSAIDSSGNAQQVTTGVQVARHPNGGFMVLFGTGSWVDVTDPLSPFRTDSFYGIWDKDDGATQVSGRGHLQKQEVIATVDATGTACTLGTASCYIIQSSCVPNYGTTVQTTSNQSDPLCPSSIAYPAGTGQQLGWVFDLPGTGERTFSDQPRLSGGTVVLTTVQPASNPCTGNTSGMEYDLSWKTGGMPPAPVFVLPGVTTGLISTTAFSGYTGAAINIAPAGHAITGGASQNAISFNANPPSSVYTPPPGMPSPPTAACVGSACPNYIPGWGFLMNLQGPTAANSRFAYSCHPPEFGGGLPVCEWKYKTETFGRLSWKQIVR